MSDNESKDSKKAPEGKGFVTAQERSRKHINVTVGVIVAAMAVIGIVGMALRGSDSNNAQAAAGAATTGAQQASVAQSAAPSQDTASSAVTEIVVAQSDEKTQTAETAVTAQGGSESLSTAQTAATASTAGAAITGTYTLPQDMNVYASASESGQVIAQLYAGNQVQVGQSAGGGWYSVTVWVGANGSYAETSGYMKLQ